MLDIHMHTHSSRSRGSSSAHRSGARKNSFSRSRGGSAATRRPFSGGGRSQIRAPFNNRRRPPMGKSKGKTNQLDPSLFVNKAVITEEVDHFTPEHAFSDFAIAEQLKAAIASKGYALPTPIQDRAIPHVLSGHDVVGIANTGTGKTAAFLIPLIDKVLKARKEQIMVVAPTRELAIQIDTELKKLVQGMRLYSVCCVGGAPIGRQIKDLRYEYHFIIGTPGRLKDLIERKMIALPEFSTIVLDEADRMLDMGFISDMRYLMRGMPQERQTLFFSATLSPEIEALIGEFLREPVRISVKTGDTSKNVEQDVVRVPQGAGKLEILHELLIQEGFHKVLVFGRTKHGVERLSKILIDRGFTAESIHGDKPHGRRQLALRRFRDNQVQILVATDVAARGLDIPAVSHVINFDLPATYEDYIHRIGRTGRGSHRGKALTFIES